MHAQSSSSVANTKSNPPMFQLTTITTTLTHKAQQSLRSWLDQTNKEFKTKTIYLKLSNSFPTIKNC